MTGFICIMTETLPAGLLPEIAQGLQVSPALAADGDRLCRRLADRRHPPHPGNGALAPPPGAAGDHPGLLLFTPSPPSPPAMR